MKGFFSVLELPTVTASGIVTGEPQCGRCGFYRKCNTPKMKPYGKGKKNILIVSEYPGTEEDKTGKALSGNSGRFLEDVFDRFGFSIRHDCHLTYALICKPSAEPKTAHINYCSPNLVNTIKELAPKVIITLGAKAIQSLASYVWKPEISTDHMKMEPWAGWQIPSRILNAWICPTYHPAYVLRQRDEGKCPMIEKFFSKNIMNALEKKERPYKESPSIEKKVDCLYDEVRILSALDRFIDSSVPVTFDYETNRRKPENPGGVARCVGLSDGRKSIAFEFSEKTRKRFIDFLKSDVPKTGHNTKFEQKWSKRMFGVWPKNVIWDTMLASHVLSNKRGITELSFQSFVRLGYPDHKNHMKKWLGAEDSEGGSYANNRVMDVPLPVLLKYCGEDVCIENELFYKQLKDFNTTWEDVCRTK